MQQNFNSLKNTKAKLIIISVLIALVYYAVLYCSFFYGVKFFLEVLPKENYHLIALLQPLTYLLVALSVYFIANRVFNFGFENRRVNIRVVFFLVLVAFLFRVFIDPIINFDIILGYEKLNVEASILNIDFKFWLDSLSSLLLVPFLEELFFRGLIFKLLMSKVNFFTSAIISSLLFSIGHINPLSLHFSLPIASFLFGLLLAAFYSKYKLKGVIIIHISYNALVLFLSLNRFYYFEFLKNLDFDWRYWSIITFSIFGLILILVNQRSAKEGGNSIF